MTIRPEAIDAAVKALRLTGILTGHGSQGRPAITSLTCCGSRHDHVGAFDDRTAAMNNATDIILAAADRYAHREQCPGPAPDGTP